MGFGIPSRAAVKVSSVSSCSMSRNKRWMDSFCLPGWQAEFRGYLLSNVSQCCKYLLELNSVSVILPYAELFFCDFVMRAVRSSVKN